MTIEMKVGSCVPADQCSALTCSKLAGQAMGSMPPGMTLNDQNCHTVCCAEPLCTTNNHGKTKDE